LSQSWYPENHCKREDCQLLPHDPEDQRDPDDCGQTEPEDGYGSEQGIDWGQEFRRVDLNHPVNVVFV
jgi:hypothetical protein